MFKNIILFPFIFYCLNGFSQQFDSSHAEICHRVSSSDGTDIQTKTIEYFNSGILIRTETFSYGLGYDNNGVFGNVSYYNTCLNSYDTLNNKDSVSCLEFDAGILVNSTGTTNTYDSLHRIIQIDSYYNGIISSRINYQYDSNNNVILHASYSFNGSTFVNTRTEYYTFSATSKLLSYVQLDGAGLDSSLVRKNFYNASDSVIRQELYNKNPVSNHTYLASKVDRIFHSSGLLLEERNYSGDTLTLYYTNKMDYYYDTLAASGKVIRKELYVTSSIPFELVTTYNTYYNSPGDYMEYLIFCDTSANCTDTASYTTYNIQNYPYSYSAVTYSAYYNNGHYDFYLTGSEEEIRDSSNKLLLQSDYSSNFPPPIYSEFHTDTFTYNVNGSLDVHCHHQGGSHIYYIDVCCENFYSDQNVPLQIELLGDSIKEFCPGEPVVIEKIIYGGTPPYVLTWNSSDISDSMNVLTFATSDFTKDYILTVTDNNGLSVSDTITIHRFYVVDDIGMDTVFCSGDEINFDAGPGQLDFEYEQYFYSLNDSIYEIPLNQFYILQSGTYRFGISMSNCFSDTIFSGEKNLIVNKPEIELGNDTILCINNPLVISAPAGLTYAWSTGDSIQMITISSQFPDSMNVSCLVTDSDGCVNSDTIRIIYSVCSGIGKINDENILVKYHSDKKTIEVNNAANEKIELLFFNILNQQIGMLDVDANSTGYIIFQNPTGVYNYIGYAHSEILTRGKFLIR